jgi:hypothetical protein
VRRALTALVLVAACAAAAYGVRHVTAPGPTEGPGAVAISGGAADWSYEIPAGTGARLDRGERLELLPPRIVARVGEAIRIVNRDDRGYLLGPFYVGPHETLTQRFTSPGSFEGACAVHPSGRLVLEVRA